MIYTAFNYLKYKIFSRHKVGHGIHSPFLYDFIVKVLNDNFFYDEYKELENALKKIHEKKTYIQVSTYGAKAYKNQIKNCSISSIIKNSSVPLKYRKLLFRIVRYYNLKQILELGTCLGVSTIYLSKANQKAKVISVEAHEPYINVAKELFHQLGLFNIELINNTFDNFLTEVNSEHFDFIFFDGNHTYDATTFYFNQCLKFKKSNSIYVFDDIYWSKSMNNAWKYIVRHPEVNLSVDLFRFGIAFFNENIFNKQHYTIRF